MRDLHTHTIFCDGKNTPEEMVLSAIEKGLDCLGICAHSYVEFDKEYCLDAERYAEFQQEIARLKEKYRGKIELLCGIEQDYYSETGTEGFDYVIGSVHYLKVNGEYISVDLTAEILADAAKRLYGGDIYALCEDYYGKAAEIAERTKCDIIGHIDLVTKFSEQTPLFSEDHPRYIAAWQRAVDALIPFGKPFEINTGAITRGYRTTPYPAPQIREYIREHGGSLILSSDAHSREHIAAYFDVCVM